MRSVMRNVLRRGLIVFAAATVGFLTMATVIGSIIDAPHLLLLQRRHGETSGQVLHLYPNSHGLVEIGYSVGRTSYKRDVPAFAVDGPRIEGGLVRVYYDPNDPSVAFAAPPGEIITGQMPSWILGSLLGAVFVVGVALNIMGYLERHT